MSKPLEKRVETLEGKNPQSKPDWQKRGEEIQRLLAAYESVKRQMALSLSPEEMSMREQEAINEILKEYQEEYQKYLKENKWNEAEAKK